MARARWHFGGGPSYCEGCRQAARPCAQGKAGLDEQFCPYLAHEPLSEAGWAAWDVLTRCAGQLRVAPAGACVVGIDLGVALMLGVHLGHDARLLAELLPAGEAGLVQGLNNWLGQATDPMNTFEDS